MRALNHRYKNLQYSHAVKPLLFDRLTDDELEEATDYYKPHLTFDNLKASVMTEIKKILNTRLASKEKDYKDLEDNLVNFGLSSLFGFSDFNSFDAVNPSQWKRIARLCEKAIQAYEPRLQNVRVAVQRFNAQLQSLQIFISGSLNYHLEKHIFNFPMDLECINAR